MEISGTKRHLVGNQGFALERIAGLDTRSYIRTPLSSHDPPKVHNAIRPFNNKSGQIPMFK